MPPRLHAAALLLLLPTLALGQPAAPSLEFLHLTDTHVTALDGIAEPLAAARAHFRNGEVELAKFLAGSTRPPGSDFILVTGDLIDGFSFVAGDGRRVFGQIEAFQRAIAPSRVPVFLLLGNHDLSHYRVSAAAKPAADQSLAGEARAAWIKAFPCFGQGTYYAVAKTVGGTKYVLLLLDNGYGAAGAQEVPASRLAHEQLYWLRRQTEVHAGATLILALHIPIGGDASSEALKGAVAGARNIALVLGGHNHRNQIEDLALGEGTAVQVRTAAFGYGVNNWRRVRLHPDRIEIFATGKLDAVDKIIPIRGGKS